MQLNKIIKPFPRHALLITIIFSYLAACSQQTTEKTLLKPQEFKEELVKKKDAQLIDVRTPEEFSNGHLQNAININFYDGDFQEQISKLDKSKPVFVYCQSGGRSSKSAAMFREKGFTEVYDMDGGVGAWINSGNELQK